MESKFKEYDQLDLASINREVLAAWEQEETFRKSLEKNADGTPFVFFEGPPSANGMPGIHHVMARSIKDIICRYKTLQGYLVERKAGWDTHGLPVELSVEKSLGITKEDIGKKIPMVEYNRTCRSEVMKYTHQWEELTKKMGYWVDMENPYITYDNRYIETLWYLLKRLYDKGLLYKGYTIQPYSPAAGTGLSTHELNQPGCYRMVKDTTCVAQFKVICDEKSEKFCNMAGGDPLYFLAWTTTPWTLPSNTALAVNPRFTYIMVKSFNPYTYKPITAILDKERMGVYFSTKDKKVALSDYKPGAKVIPFEVIGEFQGSELIGINYEQLIPWMKVDGKAFCVIPADYVTNEDGTGIVHIAPTFGADDDRAARQAGIAPMILIDTDGNRQPMVDKRGRLYPVADIDPAFVKSNVSEEYLGFAGRYVKNAYDASLEPDAESLDVELAIMLKGANKAFKIEKQEHNYPHCWRTDKPILYYPLDSWFIKTTALKDRMLELNKTINWKPASIGEGRFGKWLENLVDWNLSRSRFWGTPLPIWVSEDGRERICIGSVAQLKEEVEKSIAAGVMKSNPLEGFVDGDFSKTNYESIDLHRPHVDDIILVSASGQKMFREPDLVDVWFDSGAMPYAQLHYPFENKELIDEHLRFPADFIAEGIDQTRGWFFTLHAIATMCFDSVAYRNIISNGLVLDAKGNKMSKRLGNAVDPFKIIDEEGSDALRWYMLTNSQPWDNLKFDEAGVQEVKRKFFGTLYNTYSFFALYANVDGFSYAEPEVPMAARPELDRWILSLLNSLIAEVTSAYDQYEPTRAGRAIQEFVIENLSNWYVRLSRKRFWGGTMTTDKLSAYQTLYTCLEKVAVLASPIAPFVCDRIFTDLNQVTHRFAGSVHLTTFPLSDASMIDALLEERMELAKRVSSMVLGLRRKVQIRVRQPLSRILIPIVNDSMQSELEAVKNIILSEVNVKQIEFINDTTGILIKKIKPNFKVLGPKHGKQMKEIATLVSAMGQSEIFHFERDGKYVLRLAEEEITLDLEDVEIMSEDIPGWLVANDDHLTVALDIMLTDELREEGIARELVNRIQNLRKEKGFNVTDKINLYYGAQEQLKSAISNFREYISAQVLAERIIAWADVDSPDTQEIEIDDIKSFIKIEKVK